MIILLNRGKNIKYSTEMNFQHLNSSYFMILVCENESFDMTTNRYLGFILHSRKLTMHCPGEHPAIDCRLLPILPIILTNPVAPTGGPSQFQMTCLFICIW